MSVQQETTNVKPEALTMITMDEVIVEYMTIPVLFTHPETGEPNTESIEAQVIGPFAVHYPYDQITGEYITGGAVALVHAPSGRIITAVQNHLAAGMLIATLMMFPVDWSDPAGDFFRGLPNATRDRLRSIVYTYQFTAYVDDEADEGCDCECGTECSCDEVQP